MRMGLMKVEADAALAQKSAAQAARASRRRKEEVRKEFRMATTPNGLEVRKFPCQKLAELAGQEPCALSHSHQATLSLTTVLLWQQTHELLSSDGSVPCKSPARQHI